MTKIPISDKIEQKLSVETINKTPLPPSMEKNAFLSMDNNREKHDELAKSMISLLSGGFAGMIAKTVIAPLERTKIIFQVTNEPFSFSKFPTIWSNIYKEEGIRALWRGHSATLIRVFPYAGIQFMVFEYAKRILSRNGTDNNISDHKALPLQQVMLCGGFASMISTLATYPLDLTRSRLAVSPLLIHDDVTITPATSTKSSPISYQTSSSTHHVTRKPHRWYVYSAMRKWVTEHGVKDMYRGIVPTVLGVIPYGAIAFTTNECGKRGVVYFTGEQPHTWHKLIIGGFAGLISQSFTYPLEIIRRRMQTSGYVNHSASFETTFLTSAAKKLIQDGEADKTHCQKSPSHTSVKQHVSPSISHETVTSSMHQHHQQQQHTTLLSSSLRTATKTSLTPSLTPTSTSYLSMKDIARDVHTRYGWRGFFKGLSLNWFKGPIAISVSFTSFDGIQNTLLDVWYDYSHSTSVRQV